MFETAITFRIRRFAGTVLAGMLFVLPMAGGAVAQQPSPEQREFRVEMLASLQETAERSPDDPVFQIALGIVDAYPIIFEVVADRAMEDRRQSPAVVIEGDWMTPYYLEMINALIGLHGEMVASAPLENLVGFNGTWIEYINFLQQQSDELCAQELAGTRISLRPDVFAAKVGADEAVLGEFGRLSAGVVFTTARTILAGAEERLEGEINDADIDALRETLVADGFSEDAAQEIIDGEFAEETTAAERCDSGLRFYQALEDLPEENRRELLAFYLVPR